MAFLYTSPSGAKSSKQIVGPERSRANNNTGLNKVGNGATLTSAKIGSLSKNGREVFSSNEKKVPRKRDTKLEKEIKDRFKKETYPDRVTLYGQLNYPIEPKYIDDDNHPYEDYIAKFKLWLETVAIVDSYNKSRIDMKVANPSEKSVVDYIEHRKLKNKLKNERKRDRKLVPVTEEQVEPEAPAFKRKPLAAGQASECDAPASKLNSEEFKTSPLQESMNNLGKKTAEAMEELLNLRTQPIEVNKIKTNTAELNFTKGGSKTPEFSVRSNKTEVKVMTKGSLLKEREIALNTQIRYLEKRIADDDPFENMGLGENSAFSKKSMTDQLRLARADLFMVEDEIEEFENNTSTPITGEIEDQM